MSDQLRKKLSGIEDELRGLREEKAGKVSAREAAKVKYADIPDDADPEVDRVAYAEAMEAVRAVGEIEDRINALSDQQVGVLKMLGDKEAEAVAGGQPRQHGSVERDRGWSAKPLFEADEFRQQLEFIAGSKSRFGSIQAGEVMSRDDLAGMLASDVAVTDRMREGTYRGLQPGLVRPLTVLNLIPTGTTDGNLVPYTQESGLLTGAETVAEGDLKPESGITFSDEDAPVRTIAAWMKLRKQSLSDFAALRAIIDGRLRYIVQRHLEDQILAGVGSGSDLTGLTQVSGHGTVGYSASVPLSELILSGITNVYLNEGVPSGVVLHPTNWRDVLVEKADNGTYGSLEYVGGGPFASTPQSIWGVPAVPAQAIGAGSALVGDFALGCTLLIREGVNVLFSDSDQDDFLRNRVTMLGEMRAAFPIWRPSVFQVVALA